MKKITVTALILFMINPVLHAKNDSNTTVQSDSSNNRVQILAKKQIIRNLKDFKSLLQTAESSLRTCMRLLIKIRHNTVRGANSILTPLDRKKLAANLNNKVKQVLYIINQTQFNSFPVFGKKAKIRIWHTTFAEDQKSVAFTLKAGLIVKTLKNIRFLGTLQSFKNLLLQLDKTMDAIALERARINAFIDRTVSATTWQKLYINTYIKKKTQPNPHSLKAAQRYHLRRLEKRLFELAIQAANGIYRTNDRRQIKINWDQTILELKRLEKITGIKTIATDIPADALTNRLTSEREMLRIAKILVFKK